MTGHPSTARTRSYTPRLIAWEVTKRCPLRCRHCRAAATDQEYGGELSTQECFRVMDGVAAFAKPIIILTGGEPMARADILDIVRYGTGLGLRMVMAPCGQYLDSRSVRDLKEAGVRRISLSVDGADAATHDDFRQVPGAFATVMEAARLAREADLPFQINTTVTRLNVDQLPRIYDLALEIGAVGFHPFLLVPTGRGREMVDYEIAPDEYERALTWIYEKSLDCPIELKPTCAPHYYRIFRQEERKRGRTVRPETHGREAMAKGCLGGQSFAFLSHTGKVQICGFLDVEAGDIRQAGYDFREVWDNSPLFREMRDLDGYRGRCGLCEYRGVCGGCRARAYAMTGDYLAEEPYCVYQPKRAAPGGASAAGG